MIQLDTTITIGNLITLCGMASVVGLYLLDTRYSPKGIHADVRAIRKEVAQLLLDVKLHVDDDARNFEAVRREFGEVATALRTKVQEVELYTRDNFVRRESLQAVLHQYNESLGTMIGDLKEWMVRIEARLDNITFEGRSK